MIEAISMMRMLINAFIFMKNAFCIKCLQKKLRLDVSKRVGEGHFGLLLLLIPYFGFQYFEVSFFNK